MPTPLALLLCVPVWALTVTLGLLLDGRARRRDLRRPKGYYDTSTGWPVEERNRDGRQK